jgi:lipoyl(octanoyl) transferase
MAGQSRAQWRFLDSGPADGFTNMAIDEALLKVLAAERGVPTLRFYSWSPPALSLGYGQLTVGKIDLRRCMSLGIDVVRRSTGGGAVLHDHEVTYSVVLRADDPRLAPGLLASYLMISHALVRGLSYLGISAELVPIRRGALLSSGRTSPACFATLSSYEVAVAGRKLIGSAQRRVQDLIMQHGSIPLSHDLDKMRAVFDSTLLDGQSTPNELVYQDRMTSLQEAGGRAYDYAEVVAALSRGIAESWQVDLLPGSLTSVEKAHSAHLRATKYGSEAWTWRR